MAKLALIAALGPDIGAGVASSLGAQDASAWSFEVEASPFGESW